MSATTPPSGSSPNANIPALNTSATSAGASGLFRVEWLNTANFNLITPDNLHFVTVVNGGGVTGSSSALTNNIAPIHSDGTGTQPPSDGVFTFCTTDGGNHYTLETPNGMNFVTAEHNGGVSGSNDSTNPIHTDRMISAGAGQWEQLTMFPTSVPAPTFSASGGCPGSVVVSDILPSAVVKVSGGLSAQGTGSTSVSLAGQVGAINLSAVAESPNSQFTSPASTASFNCMFDTVKISIGTGNDQLKTGTELTATLTLSNGSQQSFCLHPSQQLAADSICTTQGEGGVYAPSYTTWANFTEQGPFYLPLGNAETSSATPFATLTLTMNQDGCGIGANNWDLQSIDVQVGRAAYVNGTQYPPGSPDQTDLTTILNVSQPVESNNPNNCFVRLKCNSPRNTFTFNLSASDPTGSTQIPTPICNQN